MTRLLTRLRWQLTLSHLIATAVTLLCMVAAVFVIATAALTWQSHQSMDAGQDARIIAESAGNLVLRDDRATLNGVLRALVDGSLRPLSAGWGWEDGSSNRAAWQPPSLKNIVSIVVIDADGQPVASSEPAGARFSTPERAAWATIAATTRADGGNARARQTQPSSDGTPALGAYPVLDEHGRPVATVVVAAEANAPSGGSLTLWRAVAIFGAASLAVLSAASVFALASAGLVAYLLSRRLVARLERLGQAAEALAAGDRSIHVNEGRPDEVGQLARRFNRMVAELDQTLHDLREERDRVAGLLDARRQLVASVSHELRTPVATARGYLESALARADLPAGDLRADLETMEAEIARVQRLIDDLFTLSRATVGRLELRPEPTDIRGLVTRLVATVAPLAWRQRRVQVIADIAEDVPAARPDPQRLEQIVSNLLTNAVRHTPPGGMVAVVVAAHADTVQIAVHDTGEGIAPADLPHVFERFYHGHAAPDAEPEQTGTGLGLALVKELTEAMDGSVQAASTPGEGSSFTVRLPRA